MWAGTDRRIPMNLRIEIREDDSGQVLAQYHKRWYGGDDLIFAQTIRILEEGMDLRHKAFQAALKKLPTVPRT